MNVKNFLIDALTSALEIGLATPDDVIEYVTPQTLGESLPRPLWARVLTACVGAPRVDAQLIVETIGVHNLCEHIPAPIIWGIVAKCAARSLGGVIPERPSFVTSVASASSPGFETRTPPPMPLAVSAPPPPELRDAKAPLPPPLGPNIPASINASALADVSVDDEASRPPARGRTPTGQRFRQSNTGIGRLASTRRPQASAAALEPDPAPAASGGRSSRRSETEVEMEQETAPAQPAGDWRSNLAVEDDQLVDWSTSEETQTVTGDDSYSRKR